MINLFQNKDLRWKRFQGGNDFDYPIDYSAALLNANQDGHVDILYRWEPDCYCHFHRHTAEVSSTVLEGELHVIDIDLTSGEEIGTKIRHAGDYAHKNLEMYTWKKVVLKALLFYLISMLLMDC